jgi:hypothetical protein
MKENSFSNTMLENMSNYKQAYSNLGIHSDLPSNRFEDDDMIRKNINNQINYVIIG